MDDHDASERNPYDELYNTEWWEDEECEEEDEEGDHVEEPEVLYRVTVACFPYLEQMMPTCSEKHVHDIADRKA